MSRSTAPGSTYRSQTLLDKDELLPQAASLFEKDKVVDWKVDEVVLSSGPTVRRGVYKTLPSRYLPYGPPSRNNPGRSGFDAPSPSPSPPPTLLNAPFISRSPTTLPNAMPP